MRVASGIDDNDDGILEPSEVDVVEYVCNGTGAVNTLVAVTPEGSGTNCTYGGQKIETGPDTNANGTLEPAEVATTEYVCNGTDGNAYDALVKVTTEPLCLVSGAERIDIGFDENNDGTLDPTEVTGTSYTNCPDGPVDLLAQWGTPSDDNGQGVAVDANGNVYVTGYTSGGFDGNTSAGAQDIFLTKYVSDGTKQWTQQWGTSGSDFCYGTAVDTSGNIYVTGATLGGLDGNTSAGAQDIFLTKYASDGTKQWTKQWGTSGYDIGYGTAVDASGNIYVTGFTYGSLDSNTSAGGLDIFLTKYASDGTKEWTKQWGSSSNDYGHGVAIDSNGNIYVTGKTLGALDSNTSAGGYDIFLTKYAPDGTKEWTQQWGTSGTDSMDLGGNLAISSDDILYLTGTTSSAFLGQSSAGGYDIFLIGYSAQ
ncbi:MAG: SBBP repeat-containing protein [Deltaproteobacteria bacterium]|nr:SBBP repeat-containing protein [Deltaproteobacteria bacterium]